ncbi:hypothetical protein [Pseudaestuariivita atlantica]|nr:hypothetical protein [Pseudaestuariivita atlantica]
MPRKTINTSGNAVFILSTTLALRIAAELGTTVGTLFQLADDPS